MISQIAVMTAVQTQNRLTELDRRGRLHHLTDTPNRSHFAPTWPTRITSRMTAVAHRIRSSAAKPQTAQGQCAQT
jgi:hypothetical protein